MDIFRGGKTQTPIRAWSVSLFLFFLFTLSLFCLPPCLSSDYNQPFYPRLSMSLISIITQTLKSQYPLARQKGVITYTHTYTHTYTTTMHMANIRERLSSFFVCVYILRALLLQEIVIYTHRCVWLSWPLLHNIMFCYVRKR